MCCCSRAAAQDYRCMWLWRFFFLKVDFFIVLFSYSSETVNRCGRHINRRLSAVAR